MTEGNALSNASAGAPAADVATENSAPVTTQAENSSDTEVALAPEDVISDSFLESFNLEDLLSADFSEDEVMSTTHRDLPSYQEVMKHLPENGRKLISNLRAMTTRKTQEVADIRKQLEAERAAVAAERQALYNGDFAQNIKTLAETPDDTIDPYTDDGMQKMIQKQAALMFQQMMQPVQQDMALQQRQMALDAFKRDNPDITNPEVRVEVAKLLQERPELKLEDSYYIVKAKMDRNKLEQLEQDRISKRQAQKSAWQKTSNGAASKPKGTPKFRDAFEAYQWHKANGVK
jgi:hypothetical protein